MSKTKRLLSMVLAIAMLMSLLPTISFAAEPEPTEFTIDFSETDTSGLTNYDTSHKYYGQRWYVEAGQSLKGSNWTVLTDTTNSNILKRNFDDPQDPKKSIKTSIQYYSAGYIPITTDPTNIEKGNHTVGIDINVPATGYYDISAKVYVGSAGGNAEVFIEGKSVGTKDLYGKKGDLGDYASVGLNTVEYNKNVYLTAGTNRLEIKNTLHNDSMSSVSNGFYSFTFTPAAPVTFDSVTLSYDQSFIPLSSENGEKLTLSAKYSDGTDVDIAKDATVSFTSSSDSIATVDKNGVVTPVAAGEVTITVSVKVGTITKDASLPLTVKEVPVTDAVEFTVDFREAATNGATEGLSENSAKPGERWYVEAGQTLKGSNWTVLTDTTNSSILNRNTYHPDNNTGGVRNSIQYFLTGYIPFTTDPVNIEKGYDTAAIEIDVKNAGVYEVSSDVYGSSAGGYAEVSIDGRVLGTKCTNKAAIGAALQTVSFDKGIYLTEGKHILTIKSSVYAEKTSVTNNIYSFTFTPGAMLDSVSLTYDKDFILLKDPNGEKLTLSAKYLNLTDVELDVIMEDATVSYKSSNESIATVTADGIVMPKAKGNVTITASVTIEKVTKEASVDLVIEDLEYDHAAFVTEQTVFEEGSETEIIATAVLSDGTQLEQSNITCTFTSDNTAAAVFEGNILKALTSGTAKITANVTFNGETKPVTMDIEVVPVTSFTLDFNNVTSDISKLTPASGGFTTHAIKVGDEFYGSNWKMLTDAENSKIFGNDPDNALKLANYGGNYFNITKNKADLDAGNDTLAIEFTSPISGNFDIDAYMYFGSAGGIAEIFIDGKSAGSFDSNKSANGGSTTKQPADFNKSVTIEKGKHILTIKNTVHPGQGTVATGFYSISFSPSGELDSATLSHSKDYILLSDTNGKKLTLAAKYTSGTYVDLEGNGVEVSFESSDTDIATVDENGVVKPVSAGNVTITATVTIDGITKEDKLTLKINDSTFEKAEIDVVRDLFFEGGTTVISATGILSDGTRLEPEDVTVRFESDNTAVATVEGNVLSTIKEGTAKITAYVTFNNVEKTVTKEIKVVPVALAGIEAKTEDNIISLLDADGSKLVVTGINNDGSVADITGAELTYKSLSPKLVTVDESGTVRAIGRGPAKVQVTATLGGKSFECIANVVASSEKTEPSLYTYEMRENALENAKKYGWAKSAQKAAIADAEYWLNNYEKLYDIIMYEGIPRSFCLGLHDGPENFDYTCAYCNEDIRVNFSSYGWETDPINRPFKVQCPNCKRLFPSNEFDDFYKLGLDQKGQFNRLRALDAHRAMLLESGKSLSGNEPSEARRAEIDSGLVLTDEERAYFGYGVEGGYLYNGLYRDAVKDGVIIKNAVYDENGNVKEPEIRVTEDKLNTFAVDDGLGWDTGYWQETVTDTTKYSFPIVKTFIPFYHHKLYSKNGDNFLAVALSDLTNAYLYTGDIKYGRAGAILIDRIADVYPSFDLNQWVEYQNSHGGKNNGKILGSIWEHGLADVFSNACDAFYPAMDDPQVIAFLSKKAAEFGLENPKTSGDLIRENCDNGILREILNAVLTNRIGGNFGMHQLSAVTAAVALDTYPETGEMIEWLAKPGGRTGNKPVTKYGKKFSQYTKNPGGEMLSQYVNDVDRDGFGNEVGSGYNQSWITNSVAVAEILYRYDRHEGFSPYNDPKYRKMFNTIYQMTMAGGYTLQLGDDERTASTRNKTSSNAILLGFKRFGNPLYAQILYNLKAGDLDSLYIDMFEKNAGDVKDEIEKVIEEYGEYKLGSRNLTGFGLAVLSGGELIKNGGSIADSDFRRDTWMFYGVSSSSHSHQDKLQMGIDAYGFNFTPDLGYPKETGSDPNRIQWVKATISHNTVVVNGKSQNGVDFAYPYHYDGDGIVKLIDADAAHAYDETDIYRRTLVSVDASDEVSYTVDFFRVKGGNEHVYSFHTQSADGVTTNDLTLVPQVDGNGNYIGSYAGPQVKPEGDPGGNPPNNIFPVGYAWLRNVRRATPSSGNFSVNFKQTDFKKQVKDSKGLNLKFTALNDWTPSQVGIVAGDPPKRTENSVIPHLDYMLIHNTGENLDTLFTSVIQPYKGEEYIESMTAVPLICSGVEGERDASRAVKVKLKSGRTDYIIYATNNELTYTLTDGNVSFDFNGFVGVYSVNEEGKNIYSYVNDGTKIGDMQTEARYSGKIKSFTQELTDENEITVTLEKELTAEEVAALAGEYVYIDSDGRDNAVYKIESASGSENIITLDIGDVTTTRGYKSASDPDAGYVYNIAEGSRMYIPLSFEDYNRPVVEKIDDATVSAGSSITLQINAEAADGESLTYIGTVAPRGAGINSETGKITWKPDSSQVGENGFLITVRDESGRESTVSFEITVYGSTTGSGNKNEDDSGTSSENAGTTGGGGGGGGGGAAPTDKPDAENSSDQTDVGDGGSDVPQDEDSTQSNNTEKTPETSGETEKLRFTDLGNHAWAADAITTLADDGIIRGTTSDTYSPGHNITRADFASLLVRAFELESDNTENFADVSASDYFASELAIARNTGIVNGIGDNKFAPRNTITRQDMMVIGYRALQKLNVAFGESIEPQYPDFANVADYAKDAVSSLISEGLVNGKSGRIAPTDYTTRAEVAVLIKRIMDYIK